MSNGTFTKNQAVIAAVVAGLVVAAMFGVAGWAFASYHATGAAKVLGVVMPAFSAVIGAAIGGGAGAAAGAAGKKTVQAQLDAATTRRQSASTELAGLTSAIGTVHQQLRAQLASPAGSATLQAPPAGGPPVSIDIAALDSVNEHLARLQVLLSQ